MKKYLILLSLIACIQPTEPIKTFPPLPILPSDNNAPIADFTVTCDELRVCLFDAVNSKVTDLPIKAYGWSFGDASVYITNIPSVQHTYKERGIYNISLMVADTKDRNGRLYKTVEVK